MPHPVFKMPDDPTSCPLNTTCTLKWSPTQTAQVAAISRGQNLCWFKFLCSHGPWCSFSLIHDCSASQWLLQEQVRERSNLKRGWNTPGNLIPCTVPTDRSFCPYEVLRPLRGGLCIIQSLSPSLPSLSLLLLCVSSHPYLWSLHTGSQELALRWCSPGSRPMGYQDALPTLGEPQVQI